MGLFSWNKKPKLSVSDNAIRQVKADLLYIAQYIGEGISHRKNTLTPTTDHFDFSNVKTEVGLSKLIQQIAVQCVFDSNLEVGIYNPVTKGYDFFLCEIKAESATEQIFLHEVAREYPVHLCASIAQQLCEIKYEKVSRFRTNIRMSSTILSCVYGFGLIHMQSYYNRSDLPNIHLSVIAREEVLFTMALLNYLDVVKTEVCDLHLNSDRLIQLKDMQLLMPDQPQIEAFAADWKKALLLSPDYKITETRKLYEPETLRAYERLCEANPSNRHLIHNRGYCYLLHGRYREAIVDFDFAIDKDPYFAYAFNNRGYCYVMLDNLQKGLDDLKVSKKLDPENAFNFRNFGIYWLKREQPELALEEMQKAISMDPKTEHIHYWLGEVYLALGQNEKAAEEFQISKSVPELPTPLYPG